MRYFKQLKTNFINMPMKGKLISLFLLSGIIPLLIISITNYANTQKIFIQETYNNVSNTNKQISTNISNHMETYSQISALLYTDNILKAHLTKVYRSDYDFVIAYEYINDLLYRLLAANSSVHSIRLYVPNKTIPSDGKFVMHIEEGAEEQNWIIHAPESYGNVLFHGAEFDKKGERVVSLGRMLNFNNQNYSYAYLVIEIREDVFYSLIKNESTQKDIYILDKQGNIISTKDKSSITQNLNQVIGMEVITEQKNRQEILKINGERTMLVYNTMPNGWKTVTMVALNDITSEVKTNLNRIMVIAVSCISLSIILILFISRYFSKRLLELNHQVAMIEEGDFTYQAGITSQDEMGRLSASIDNMAKKLDEAVNEVYKKEIQRKRAELILLQSQINPHFLYNTLAGISAIALRNDDEEAYNYVNHLSQFYKISLNRGKEYITIQEEVKITRHYIALQNMRFRDIFKTHWEVEEGIENRKTLKLLLQPFIENIVNHALNQEIGVLNIKIQIRQEKDDLVFAIQDDGVGISEEKLKVLLDYEQSSGYGIINVNDRIKLAYGEEYSVQITSALQEGTTVIIKIPYEQPFH